MPREDYSFKEVFPLMTFDNDEEQVCRKYMKTRGVYLYKQVYDALVKWTPHIKEIKYLHFSNLIRYDKSIRDKLYVYLAAAEEYLRNIIFDELEIDELPHDTTQKKLNVSDLRKRTENELEGSSNLYFYSYAKNFDFGLIQQIFDEFKLAEKYGLEQSDIKAVRELLRNKVMHHNMLLLSCFTERKDIEREISEIESGIEALYRILPTIELREGSENNGKVSGGLTQAINKSNYPDGDITKEPFENAICLHKFKDGRFIRQWNTYIRKIKEKRLHAKILRKKYCRKFANI